MKTFFAILLTVLLPFPCDAGLLFGPRNQTIVNNYGTAPTVSYVSAPVVTYTVPSAVYSGPVVRSRSHVRTRVRHGRTHVHTHIHEHY